MVRFYAATLAGAMLLSMGIAGAARAEEGDAAAGEKVFNACKACHSIDAGAANRVGPNLHGVVGRKAGSVESYKYSDAIKNSGLTWDEQTLNEYLKDPKTKVPGNKMAFPGVKDDKQRVDLTAYLKKQS